MEKKKLKRRRTPAHPEKTDVNFDLGAFLQEYNKKARESSTATTPSVSKLRVAIPRWKTFNVSRFAVQPTYEGFLEGTVSGINRTLKDELAKVVASSLQLDHFARPPLHLPKIDIDQALPGFLCMALLEAASFDSDADDDFGAYSMCGVCWFVDDLTPSIDELISKGVKPFNWRNFASNASM
jgi:hypothetical protein